jgi:hypothetical protein
VRLPQVHWGVKVGLICVAAAGFVGVIYFVVTKGIPPTPDEPTLDEIETIAAIMEDMADVIADVEATVAAHWDRAAANCSANNTRSQALRAKMDREGIALKWLEGRLLGMNQGQTAEKYGA